MKNRYKNKNIKVINNQSEIEIIFNLLGIFNFNVFSLFRNNKNTSIGD